MDLRHWLLNKICNMLSMLFNVCVCYSRYPNRRVSGHCICSFCNREYYDHVALHRLCEGDKRYRCG